MNKEKEDFIVDKLMRLDGHVLALTVALQSLVLETPDPLASAERAKERIERFLSQGLGSAVNDAFLAGVQEGQRALFPDQRSTG